VKEEALVPEQPPTPPAANQWRIFLRALADEIDSQGGEQARDELLRCIGRRMAILLPLPETLSLEALEIEINEALDVLGWGSVTLTLESGEHNLMILHTGLPRVGGAGNPPGQWLSAVLEGLYETWLPQQPGGGAAFVARRVGLPGPFTIALSYGKL
jgi:hypothetical protein